MEEYKQTKKGKEGWVDTLGNVSYSLAVGSALDYAAGLNGLGILASRAYATGMNLPTAAPYGKWRNFVFKSLNTTNDSSKLRKGLTDLLAFNTFQVPVYASAIAVGSLISEGKIDLDKTLDGARNLAMISPLIAPTMGWYMDRLRGMFNLKSAAEKAGEEIQNAR